MRPDKNGREWEDDPESFAEAEEETDRKRKNKRAPKTRRQIVRRRIIMLASVCAALFILFALYKNWARPPELNPGEVTQHPPAQGGEEKPQTGSGRKSGWYTFLLCGVDDGNGGGDTIMVAAFDTVGQKINIVSIPRDTLINVAWHTKKINSAYNAGGVERLKEEVSKLIGFSVDFYVKVDLRGFVELVDAIGGVEFDVPFNMNYDDPTQNLHIHIKKGPQKLEGKDAIGVVRWRKNNDGSGYRSGDIGRIETQQAFLKELARQVLTIGNLPKVPEFASIFSKYVETDLSLGNLVWLGQKAMGVGSEHMQFFTMPGDYSASYYSMKSGRYVSYVVLDIDEVVELMNLSFNPYTTPITKSMLDIMTIQRNGAMASSRGVLQDPSAAVPPTIPSRPSGTQTPSEGGKDEPDEPPQEAGETEPNEPETPPDGSGNGASGSGGTGAGNNNTGNTEDTEDTGDTETAPAEDTVSLALGA